MNKDFNRYYQQVRGKQKREALIWSGLMLVLYLWSGNVSELNLKTIIVSAPSFFDYIGETSLAEYQQIIDMKRELTKGGR